LSHHSQQLFIIFLMSDRSTAPPVTIRCLGAFEVSLNSLTVTAFPTDKIRALMAYLALETAQPHRREVLAGLLWPEMPQPMALTNLRLALHRLRQTLDQAAPGAGEQLLLSTRQTLHLNPDAAMVDVMTFQALLAACADHPHSRLANCEPCMAHLSQAVELYRGELLAGFGLADAPAFEEWLLLRREMLHQQVLAALHSLLLAYELRQDDHHAHRYASRQLALDPYREEAHRQLMRILARQGLPREALAQYETCRQLLREQLDVEPDAETTWLAEQIRTGQPEKMTRWQDDKMMVMPEHPVILSPLQDWGDVPGIAKLYGRQTELAQLERWLIHERCRLIAILGMGGVGKTTLAAAAIKAASVHFHRVIWRSVLNALLPAELLRDLLQTLANQRLTALPTTLDGQLALLLDQLRQQRCLLVLDNLESILQSEQPGRVRPGYEGYAQLMQQIAERGHQSCLMLTSRERPLGMEHWEEDTPLVRTLPLEGLDATAGQGLLVARGLSGPATDAAALVRRYSGNPLALKLVAQTVHELFAGDIGAFLAVEAPIFDDIRTVLDQQFARLSPLEQEILIWLAIEREPTPVQPLRENLISPGSQRAFLEALRALQRRSLVSQSGQGFVLQNVVTEYLTNYLVEQVCQEILDFRFAILDSESDDSQSKIQNPKSEILNHFALLKATAKEYVRLSQVRLIVQPIAQQLLATLGRPGLVEKLNQILATLRIEAPMPGYAAGNLLNLLLHLGVDLRGYDFAHLNIWQAYLQGKLLPEVNFYGANLAHSVFTYAFGDILALHFAADGQLRIAGLLHGKLCLWRAADGQLLREYQSFGAGASIARFSPNGELLASADTDHNVRLWDVERGQLLHTLSGHPETPWMVLFSPQGSLIASSGGNGTIHLWEVATGSRQQTFQGPASGVQSLAFTADGQLLASGHVDGTICLWRTSGGGTEPLRRFHGHSDVVHALVFAADGDILASGSYDRSIRLWEVSTGESLHTLHAHTLQIRWLALSADGYTLASGGHDQFVCLWDARNGARLHTLLGHAYPIYHITFRADGRLLATVGIDQTIYLWDVATGQRLDTLQVYRNELHSLRFSADGQWLACGGDDAIPRLWDVRAALKVDGRTGRRRFQTYQGHTRSIYAVALRPDGETLASAGREQTIWLWDVRSGRHLRTFHGHTGDIRALDFSPNGAWLTSASRDKTVRVWEVESGHVIQTLQDHTDQVLTCAFSPDGRLLASGSYDRTVRVWEMPSGRLLHTLVGHAYGVKWGAFSPDGQLLASSSYDRTMRVWDTATGQVVYAWPAQNTLILSLAFHPAGALLATGATDYSVRLWEVSSGRLLATLRGHTNLIESVCFSPDGQWLASCGADETIRLWEVASALAGGDACRQTLQADGPYSGMNITGVTGISAAQKAALKALGAVED
jgi:WD40 repeat protein/DNA-binding SARP family transcriptional activator